MTIDIAAAAKPGKFPIEFQINGGKIQSRFDYLLACAREKNSANREGFSAKDAIYLITPDRFANGDTPKMIQLLVWQRSRIARLKVGVTVVILRV